MKKKKDMEVRLFLFLFHLKEEKNKVYSSVECEKDVVYLFDGYDEFKSYFVLNGFDNINDELLSLCCIKTTKKGTVIALKGLCDHTIRTHNLISPKEESVNPVLNSLGKKGIENIINNSTFPDKIYRPNYNVIVDDNNENIGKKKIRK